MGHAHNRQTDYDHENQQSRIKPVPSLVKAQWGLHSLFPGLFGRLVQAFAAIGKLHDAGLCHGDIRTDHLLFDRESGALRWIDFDLVQSFSDYDMWSVGNILAWCVGMGEHTFQSVRLDERFPEKTRSSLDRSDGSVFFNHRIFNLRKLFPYVPEELNAVLLRFSLGSGEGYETMEELLEDLRRARRPVERAEGA